MIFNKSVWIFKKENIRFNFAVKGIPGGYGMLFEASRHTECCCLLERAK
jgi:hypothetical protein